MLILTNCLTDTVDEGCLKVANSLVKRLKNSDSQVCVLTYEREHSLSDKHINVNKLLLNGTLRKTIRQRNKKETLLYIPFPAKTLHTALRIFVLSVITGKTPSVLMVMQYPHSFIAKLLLRMSRARIITLSEKALDFYGSFINSSKVTYIPAGVDTERFVPVSVDKKTALRRKYNLPEDASVVLHVGHLNEGRNVGVLKNIPAACQGVLVCSTLTKSEQDANLRRELEAQGNIRIIDDYLPDIQEIYQTADVYLFPTTKSGCCIDVPLSCLEAAACNIPVVCTDFGELEKFRNKEGFFFLSSTEDKDVCFTVDKAMKFSGNVRDAVLSYDWNRAVNDLKSY